VQGGYGVVFAIRVQVLLALRVSRYKYDRSREFITGYKVGYGHLRSVAVQAIPKPGICHGEEFKLRVDAGVRVQDSAGFVTKVGFCKNHDELIDPTVRVRNFFNLI